MRRTALTLFVLSLSSAVNAQSPAPAPTPAPCSSAEHRQFDFWLGDWEVKAPDGKLAGTNRIERIQDGCVLLESWTGSKGGTGNSFNMYFAADKKWHQTWVDNGGGRLDLSGGIEGGKMRLLGEGPAPRDPSRKVSHEITWEKVEGGNVRQVWRSSTDGGKTWGVGFDGIYVKKSR